MRTFAKVAITAIAVSAAIGFAVIQTPSAARARGADAVTGTPIDRLNRESPVNVESTKTTAVAVGSSDLLMGSAEGQGAADEHPQHRVRISGFTMDRFEVTNERYGNCVKAGRCAAPALPSSAKRKDYFASPAFMQYPVVFVDWQRADTFCRWEGGRLPTEAEWELAARGPAPNQRRFPWGDSAPDCTKANLSQCIGDTDTVGRRPDGNSLWGISDLAGNVWEWTNDWYDPHYYARSPIYDPKGPPDGSLKVMRGGCFMSGPDSLRVSCRKAELPSTWAPNVGFRCVH